MVTTIERRVNRLEKSAGGDGCGYCGGGGGDDHGDSDEPYTIYCEDELP
jgi:hypothetical protein